MQAIIRTSVLFILFLATMHAVAQTKTGNKPVKPAAAKKDTATSQFSMNDLKKADSAMKNLKTTMATVFGGARNQITIQITGIEYDDENLSLLKEEIKKIKGVKDMGTAYKAGTAKIALSFKGGTDELWQAIPKEARQSFKLTEATGNTIIAVYKNGTGITTAVKKEQ